ncbi:hypothetical protein D3C72_613450 [compost metagenome]
MRIGFGAIDLITFDIAGHEAQPRYAERGHVQVITSLDGALVGGVEVGVLNRVGQPDRVHTDVVEILVAIDLLISQGELVGPQGIGRLCRPARGVQFTGTRFALVLGLIGRQAKIQRLLISQRDRIGGTAEVLTPDIDGLTGVRHQAEVAVDFIGAANEVDTVSFGPTVSGEQFVIGVGRGSIVECGEVASLERNSVELFARQLEAGSGFRQQAVVTGGEYRSSRALFAVLQHGGGNAHLHCAADLAIAIWHFGFGGAVVADGQQAVADPATASVQLDATEGEGIGAETDGALGETGGEVEHGPLCPLLAIAIALAGRLGAVGTLAIAASISEVAIHIEITIEQPEAAVFNEAIGFLLLTSYCQLRGGGNDSQGERA